jgi:hypothetical protein
LIDGGETYLQIVGQADHAGHALCSGFGFEFSE